jgi:hypothetical protein
MMKRCNGRTPFEDLVIIADRGISLSHTAILRWVQRYLPEFESGGGATDETYSRFADTGWTCTAQAGSIGLICRLWSAIIPFAATQPLFQNDIRDASH